MKTVWHFIITSLQNKLNVVLCLVVDSKGSSPGRKDFAMAVNSIGIFKGTIGGGIMEVKLIEMAKNKLLKNKSKPLIKTQYHHKKEPKNQSGMICSGEQTIVLMPLTSSDTNTVMTIANAIEKIKIKLSTNGLEIVSPDIKEHITIGSEENFDCVINLYPPPIIHIFGAGHVGQALAIQMELLAYRVLLYDNRKKILDMMEHKTRYKIINYEMISELFKNIQHKRLEKQAAVIASFSYRDDETIIKQVYDKPFAYIGMMGSEAKIKHLRQALNKEGISDKQLDRVFMPIGVNIYSKTATEIAVSIAAQIIQEKNKKLSTGRTYTI